MVVENNSVDCLNSKIVLMLELSISTEVKSTKSNVNNIIQKVIKIYEKSNNK